jgi:hypothetical protein
VVINKPVHTGREWRDPIDASQVVTSLQHRRCAISTCRRTTVEVAHIVPWAEVKTHEFANLIALCPNCHTAYDSGRIDRQSMLRYKSNLALLSSRYGDVERRVLEYFALNPKQRAVWLPWRGEPLRHVPPARWLLGRRATPYYPSSKRSHCRLQTVVTQKYQLTDAGRAFVNSWTEARSLET